MAYNATVLPVMIASPGDVDTERGVIRQVIHDWNDVNASTSKIILEAVGWDSHSSPELGARPQELINSRLLSRCDIVVGVFWTRLGSPTGESESGTAEEIERHVKAAKPAMIYICNKPVAPDNLDTEQYTRLKDFKSRLLKQGLIESFDTTEELRSKFYKQLSFCLNNNKHIIEELEARQSEREIASQYVGSISEQLKPISSITDDAKQLLLAAAEKEDGTILNVAYMGGQNIRAGSKTFGSQRGKETARWTAALDELLSKNLVVARGNKGQIFELTHFGWQLAETIGKSDI